MSKIILSKEDREELVKLYETAERTPVIRLSTGGNLASQAWFRVRQKMNELGKKYGFNPKEMKGIDEDTGEILL